MANEDIRRAAINNGVKLWQIAEQFGVTDTTFSKKLRHEFTAKEKAKAMDAIKKIRKERAKYDLV